ncbi:DUF948 domain-containing protein [candidate division KSB1 bacterium]|nr:DUF948 domain-containing protein [candidate division KSB1 bacterium]
MIVNISVVVIAVFIVVLVVAILIFLVQLRRTVKEAEKFIELARLQIAPIAHDITLIIGDGKKISDSFKNQVQKLDQGVDAIKNAALNVKNFQLQIEDRVRNPLLEVISVITVIAQIIQRIRPFFVKEKKED